MNLLLRFYDPEFGQITINGQDLRQYDVSELRRQIGYVSQEPVLFNCSVKDNILYGKQRASNAEIKAAVEVVGAADFIESESLNHNLSDEPASLLKNMESTEYRESAINELGKEKYAELLEMLRALVERQKTTGVFQPISDAIDTRSEENRGEVALHTGYHINCGNNGSKLSAGQK